MGPRCSCREGPAAGASCGVHSRAFDNELAPSVPISWFSPQDPLIDFRKMLNNESTLREDLVRYFNLGNRHVPTTQDIPNTLTHSSGTSVMFTPFNYSDRLVAGMDRALASTT